MATTASTSDNAGNSSATAVDAQAIEATQRWLERAVIGLNLCPFAKAVHHRCQIRYVVSSATDSETLSSELVAELLRLQATPAIAWKNSAGMVQMRTGIPSTQLTEILGPK